MYVQRQEALEKERAAAKRAYSLIEQVSSLCLFFITLEPRVE